MPKSVAKYHRKSKFTTKRKGTKKRTKSVTKRKMNKSSTKRKGTKRKGTKRKKKSSKKRMRGGAIRMPSEYFGKDSGRYGADNHKGVSFPNTDLYYTH